MLITPAALDSIFVGFNTRYQQGFKSAMPSASVLATDIPSSGRSNVYAWMTKLLRMRQWVGERVIQNMSSKTYTLTNIPFELTIAVPRVDIVDDDLGVYAPRFMEMGEQTSLWMDDLLVLALQNGGDAVLGAGWDGVPFFSASHPVDVDGRETLAVQSNLLTAATFDATTFDACRVRMATYKGSDNRPLGTRLTHVLVPPQLETAARRVTALEFDTAGASNVFNGTAKIIVLPQLAADATTWYGVDLSRVIKPLISQTREAPDFVAITDPASEPKFNRDEYIFGSQARGAAGYGLWFTAIKNRP